MMINNAPFADELATRGNTPKVYPWVLGTFLGAVLTLVVVGALVWLSSGLRGRTQINVNQPTVVHQIQQLQRLETVNYTMDKIISGEQANAYLTKFLAGVRLMGEAD